ncbi:MAG TPA: hypothetical protein PKL84_07060, partial [Candidatus Hydrogenedentes bacterium]|nr:hypothetical protein [Candidatus Hydrogenedentota bacterium]
AHITTGTIDFNRLPVAGTGSASTVARSDHTHPQKWLVTKAIPYAGSGYPRSGNFSCSTGSTILLFASASAYLGGAGTMQVDVRVDGSTRGSLRAFTNEGLSHKALNSDAIIVTGLGAGLHQVSLVLVSGAADTNDYSHVTVVELIP